jgi:putative endonuclease
MASNSTKMAGDKGEELAASFLIDNGFELLERNFRYSRYGEIDLIMRKNSLIVFVEVRYKKEKQSINAVHSITKSKLHRLKKPRNRISPLMISWLKMNITVLTDNC